MPCARGNGANAGRAPAASGAAVATRAGAARRLSDLGATLWERPALAGAYNFGPDAGGAVAVRDLVELARAAFGEGEVRCGARR